MKIQIKLSDLVVEQKEMFPVYATPGSAGLDLRYCSKTPISIQQGCRELLTTGISIFIEDPNVAAFILPRSGMGHKKGIILGNGTGLIDSDYQGELLISAWNTGQFVYQVQPFQSIAQIVFLPIMRVEWDLKEQFEPTERGEGGFGSTGVE